jgi:prepilin-type N-terminal cleavage/methylation domain-containing protein
MHCKSKPTGAGGFTLIELSVVMFIIALVMAIALPQLAAVISSTQVEGEARHISNYGRAVMAQAELMHDDITVRIDLDEQAYWAVHLITPSDEGEAEGEKEPDQMALLSKYRSKAGMSSSDFGGMLGGMRSQNTKGVKGTLGLSDKPPDGYDDDAANKQLEDKFDKFARKSLETRAKNVKREAGILDEIGPLFDKKDKFKLNVDDEPVEEEIVDPVVQRQRVMEGNRIESVTIDGASQSRGTIEVKIGPLGLSQSVVFYVVNSEGEYYTVLWDPVTGGTNVFEGREQLT